MNMNLNSILPLPLPLSDLLSYDAQPVSPKLLARVAVALLAFAAAANSARANGAFPDSQSIILPPDQPHRILLSTNFGVIVSEDDGATWHWICEQAVGSLANRYQIGPSPNDWLFAVTAGGMATSRDGACTWTKATGGFETQSVLDVFPDPTDPMKVYLLAPQSGDGGA